MARTRKRRMMNQINVVPYIDVTLVLLVIFMVTAPMTNPGVVDLPKVGDGALEQKSIPPIVVTVKLNNKIEFEGASVTRDVLLLKVNQAIKANPQRAVVIAADKNAKYEDVTTIVGMFKKKDIKLGLLLAPSK